MDNMQEQQETPVTPNFADHKKGGVGPVLGIIVIIILLALGGLYYFTKGIGQIPNYDSGNQDDAMMQMQEQSNSDALSDIDADVQATDFSEIDATLSDLDADASAQ